jgi:hypothetical protein
MKVGESKEDRNARSKKNEIAEDNWNCSEKGN